MSYIGIREILIGYAVVWTAFALWSVPPGYVHQDTAEIAMWSHIGFHGGYDKHPPLLPWLFRIVSFAVPLDQTSLAVLAALNMTLGAWAVLKIAERLLPPEHRTLTLALFVLSSLVTWQAVKLNHNSALISIWPLTILAFLRFRDDPTIRNGTILGLAGGLALLAKLYSVLLLGAMALLLLATDAKRYVRAAGSWLAAALVIAVVAPHAVWVLWIDGGRSVVVGQPMPGDAAGSAGKMVLRNLSSIAPMLLASLLLFWRGSNVAARSTTTMTRMDIWSLTTMMAVPYGVTLAGIAFAGLRGSPTWAMPISSILPVLLAGTLPRPSATDERRLRQLLLAFLATVLLAIPVVRYQSFRRGEPSAVDPRADIADTAIALWRRTIDAKLALVAGDHQYAMTAALRAAEHPRAWPLFHDWHFADRRYADTVGFLAICEAEDRDFLSKAAKAAAGGPALTCRITRRQSLLKQTARPFSVVVTLRPPPDLDFRPGSDRACAALADG